MTVRERVAKAIYEADPESGYRKDDPRTYWRAPDSYWSAGVWETWLRIADAAIVTIEAAKEFAAAPR